MCQVIFGKPLVVNSPLVVALAGTFVHGDPHICADTSPSPGREDSGRILKY